MAWRAMLGLGFDCRLVKSIEITQGALLGKRGESVLFLAPGGSARRKADVLGRSGLAAIRGWLAAGGVYFGFCGGAGFALTQKDKNASLGICPWSRGSYPSRVCHLLSGHVLGLLENGEAIPLPVWWPGRFAPREDTDVRVLARYVAPTDDLWLADLPVARIPQGVISSLGGDLDWQFNPGLPLAITGQYGKGRYLLSYAHLETPDSSCANSLLVQYAREFCGLDAISTTAPVWDTGAGGGTRNGETQPGVGDQRETLARSHAAMATLVDLGVELGLFFRRTSWLVGWRPGLPGIMCNNLLAALSVLARLEPGCAAHRFWNNNRAEFQPMFNGFLDDASKLFWKLRAAKTLEPRADSIALEEERTRLFGHPMAGGGVAEKLLEILDELIFLTQLS